MHLEGFHCRGLIFCRPLTISGSNRSTNSASSSSLYYMETGRRNKRQSPLSPIVYSFSDIFRWPHSSNREQLRMNQMMTAHGYQAQFSYFCFHAIQDAVPQFNLLMVPLESYLCFLVLPPPWSKCDYAPACYSQRPNDLSEISK